MTDSRRVVQVGGAALTIQDLIDIAYAKQVKIEKDPAAARRLAEIYSYVEAKVKAAIPDPDSGASAATRMGPFKRGAIYGVTTGFGAKKGEFLPNEEAARRLQENIVLSHSAGTGSPLPDEVVRAVMLLRAHTLARGYSGIRLELLDHLIAMLNFDVLPVIPQQGSVGCSGDLAPLAHLALGLIGHGEVRHKGTTYANLRKLKEAEPALGKLRQDFTLSYKEGLALINGISISAAWAALNLRRASRLLLWADVIGAMTAEAILFAPRAFDKIVFELIYAYKGAAISAANVRAMTHNSGFMNESEEVHDPYSVRCIPQVHGAVRDTLRFAESTVANHLNSVDDDPVFFSEEEVKQEKNKPRDGWGDRLHFEDGHFHGAPVGYAMDFMSIAMADLGSISERRIAMLVDKNYNRGKAKSAKIGEVPGFLTFNRENTTSGVMIAQYTAASLVSENKTLAHPASVDSIPTSANHEDHVSMCTWATRKAGNIITNVESILAIELLCATLALAFRTRDLRVEAEPSQGQPQEANPLGAGTAQIYKAVKNQLDQFKAFKAGEGHEMRDCILFKQVELVKQMLNDNPPAGPDIQLTN